MRPKSVRRDPRARGRPRLAVRRRGARPRRGERRRKVDARQDPGGRSPDRRGGSSVNGESSGAVGAGPGTRSRGDCDHLPGADPVPRPDGRREHLHRPGSRFVSRQTDRHRCDARRGSRDLRPGSAYRLDPGRIARGLSIAEQQIVEIAKALSLDARVIVMDEPTAALSAVEVELLFRVVETLRAAGSGGALHLAQARGGLRPLPACDRAA